MMTSAVWLVLGAASGHCMRLPVASAPRCGPIVGMSSSPTPTGSPAGPTLKSVLQSVLSREMGARLLAGCCALSLCLTVPDGALAVSGGGKDYSGENLEGADFSGKQLRGKEFRGIYGQGANFAKAGLQGTSFFKADLIRADLSGADLSSASLEEAGLEDADLSDALLVNSYLTRTIADAKSIKGADFTDAVVPAYTQKLLCERADAAGTNSKTGIDTRDSLMCP